MPATARTVSRAPAARRGTARGDGRAKPAVAPDIVTVTPKPVPAAAKPVGNGKDKVLRDTFRIPKSEYAILDELKQRAARAGHPAKKSEVLRAGVKVLAAMGEAAFVSALQSVPQRKAARPAKS